MSTSTVERYSLNTEHMHFSQQEMQSFLESQGGKNNLTAVLDYLYEWSMNAGYLTPQKLNDNPHYQYPDPNTGITYKTQVNIARSLYSPSPIKTDSARPLHCPICFENIGTPSKENCRAFEFELTPDRQFFVQMTPFPIHPYHAVIIDRFINPMIMEKKSVTDMLAFLKKAPEYTVMSNSDVVGAGASITSHHHYQAIKKLSLPIMQAKNHSLCAHSIDNHSTSLSLLNYPIACAKISSVNETVLIELAGNIILKWKQLAPGLNTCNLLLHKKNNAFILYILFRNPSHLTPHYLQEIKSEFIGIIEVCGEGIYPVPTGNNQQILWDKIERDGLNIIKGIISGNNPIPYNQFPSFFQRILSWI